jgi:uncharacterized integral membrane protein
MKMVKALFIVILSFGLALVIIQNRGPVQGHFLWFTAELPAIVLLFLAAAEGFLLGMLVVLLVHDNVRSKP